MFKSVNFVSFCHLWSTFYVYNISKTYLNYLSWSEVVNWLQSSVLSPLERIWKKANFLHVGGCSGRMPLLVPVQKNFEGILASRNVWMPRERRGGGLFAIVCWQWRNLNIKRQPTKPLWDLSRWIFCWELWRFEFLAAMAALYLHLCVEWWPLCGPTSEFLYKKWFKSNFKGHKYVRSLKFSPFCDWFSACELHW